MRNYTKQILVGKYLNSIRDRSRIFTPRENTELTPHNKPIKINGNNSNHTIFFLLVINIKFLINTTLNTRRITFYNIDLLKLYQ